MYTATASYLLAALLALSLTSCASGSPPVAPPPPPRVDCQQQWGDDPGPEPATEDAPAWIEYAASLLGLIVLERQQRQLEHGCLRDLKQRGLIR